METTWNELFRNPLVLSSLPGFLVNLALAALLGYLLGKAYVRFGQSLSNRKSFARNFLLLAVTTALIISIVKSSLALSLGLVGALSIVRFRAAIKEPEELAFLFLAIGIGLGLGAGQVLITLVASLFLLLLVALRGVLHKRESWPSLYLSVSVPATAKLGVTRLVEEIDKGGGSARLARLDDTPEKLEALFAVEFKDLAALELVGKRLRELSDGVRISYVEDKGLSS